MLAVLLLLKISRNLIEFQSFKTSSERIFFSIGIVFLKTLKGTRNKEGTRNETRNLLKKYSNFN